MNLTLGKYKLGNYSNESEEARWLEEHGTWEKIFKNRDYSLFIWLTFRIPTKQHFSTSRKKTRLKTLVEIATILTLLHWADTSVTKVPYYRILRIFTISTCHVLFACFHSVIFIFYSRSLSLRVVYARRKGNFVRYVLEYAWHWPYVLTCSRFSPNFVMSQPRTCACVGLFTTWRYSVIPA